LTLRIPRRLESPNTWNGRHWRVKHRISQEWEKEVWSAYALSVKARTVPDVLVCMNAVPALKRRPESIGRMRVLVERRVASARNFIRDDDNLRFAVKPLLDALKRQGYIRNDSRTWLEHPTPTQSVSPDGKDWTIVTLEPCS
jgi:hypothetical protein